MMMMRMRVPMPMYMGTVYPSRRSANGPQPASVGEAGTAVSDWDQGAVVGTIS
jgi:hypothetical protein